MNILYFCLLVKTGAELSRSVSSSFETKNSPYIGIDQVSSSSSSSTTSFSYTGNFQYFVVPYGVSVITANCYGAQGGSSSYSSGGMGSYVSANIYVSSGQYLYIMVGGAGLGSGIAGYNGGGSSGMSGYGGGGGGATDVRTSLSDLFSRLVVAGGGGGAGVNGNNGGLYGGQGGGLVGGNGAAGYGTQSYGGSQIGGGTGGTCSSYNSGSSGALGLGGSGGIGTAGGGGGGGYYGGGGGSWNGGGGGSSYVSGSSTLFAMTQGTNSGNGYITLSYTIVTSAPTLAPSLLPSSLPTFAPTEYDPLFMQGKRVVKVMETNDICIHIFIGVAMCSIAAAMSPNSKGQTGWRCVGQIPTTSLCSWAGLSCDSTGLLTDMLLNGLYLTGTIPSNIGLATSLTNILLNDNKLNGPIPSGLALLGGLLNLDLSRNLFTGTIPDIFYFAQSLQFLALSSNSLTGTVPSSLCYEYDLTSFYVDGNKLSCNNWECLSFVQDLKLGTSNLCSPGKYRCR